MRRSLQDPATTAWNLATTAFYKAGGKPWKLAHVRPGVCYVGLVFKKLDRVSGPDNACCGAQMFLSSGDGVVFRGAVGPWYSEDLGSFHLTKEQARTLLSMAVEAYKDIHGEAPSEIFIHGRIRYDNDEWAGFSEAVSGKTNLVGVQIAAGGGFRSGVKLFRYGKNPVLRGVALIEDDRHAYLFTKGWIPRLRTYPGREVPNPLVIDIRRGEASMEQVLEDIMALTKLNFNSANFSDGIPVTLRFANQVGEILTAGPQGSTPPLPFKFYI